MFVVVTAYAGSLTNDRNAWAAAVGFWNFYTRQILEIPTDRPTKVCEKTVRFLEKLTCSKWSCTSVGFLRGRLWFPLWSNVVTNSQKPFERSGSWARKKRCSLMGLPASAKKDMFVVLTAACGFLDKQSIPGRSDFETCFTRQILEIPTDWPQNICEKTVRLGKSLGTCSKKGCSWVGFSRRRVWFAFWAPWFRRSGERGFDCQRRMIPSFGDPLDQRHVGGWRRDTHTADKVLTHGQTLLFYRYRLFNISVQDRASKYLSTLPQSVPVHIPVPPPPPPHPVMWQTLMVTEKLQFHATPNYYQRS